MLKVGGQFLLFLKPNLRQNTAINTNSILKMYFSKVAQEFVNKHPLES